MSLLQALSSQPWLSRVASTLMHFLWQGVLVAALYAITRNIVGYKRTAGFRYLIACGALAAMVAAPIATFEMLGTAAIVPSELPVTGGITSSALNTGKTFLSPITAGAAATLHGSATTWIVLAWFTGMIAFWVRLAAGWIVASRVRSVLVRPAPVEWQRNLDRLRTRIGLSRPVRLLVSAVVQVPTVVGWLRPIVLVPVGALTGLPPELVEALLTHELAHIRRHDYLINVLQGVAETVLFYHPAVWWISRRIREERELCCDDIAVEVCGDPLTYVRALTELESCRPEHLIPVLAANGGSLSGRIGRLLGMPQRESSSLMSPVVAAILLVAAVVSLSGQSAAVPAFEAASVRQNKSGGSRAPSMILPGGRFTATNNTVRALILNAYGINASPSLLSGGPNWIDSETYDIDARAEANAIPSGMTGKPLWDKTRLMLRTLLAERFKLSMHRDTKEMSIYELVVAKGGPKLKPSVANCAASPFVCHGFSGNPMRLTGTGIDMYDLALILTNYSDRLVVDKTGVPGLFDLFLQWNPFAGRPDPPVDDTPRSPASASKEGPGPDRASLPSVFDALQQQVGLRLQAQKGPVEAWVIDRVEHPTEN